MNVIGAFLRRYRQGPARADRRQARAWVVQLASGRVTAAEAQAFRDWHAADPHHAAAFAEARRHWDVMGGAVRALSVQPAFGAGPAAAAPVSRRWMVGAGLATAAAAGVACLRPPFDLWSPVVDFSADYHTGIGERRSIALGQDVSVELTTRSRLAVRADQPHAVRVALLAGEAAFTAESRPLTVVAGPGEARVSQGRVDLRHDGGSVQVTCLAGSVEVVCGGATVSLGPARQVRYGTRGVGLAQTVDTEQVAGWQRGVLVFHNQPLRRVVAEINRYRSGRIILIDQELGSRPVAVASFHLDQLDQVVPQIEVLYGVQAHYLPGGFVLLG